MTKPIDPISHKINDPEQFFNKEPNDAVETPCAWHNQDQVAKYAAERTHLKKMLQLAKSLHPDSPGRADVITRIETELLYLKLWLNTAY